MLRVLEVRNERRAYLDEQGFQLAVRRTRDQRFIERVEDLGVVDDFVIHVPLIERVAGERLQTRDVLVAARLYCAARVVLLWRHLQLRGQRHGLLIDGFWSLTIRSANFFTSGLVARS